VVNWTRFDPNRYEIEFNEAKLAVRDISPADVMHVLWNGIHVIRDKKYRNRYRVLGRTDDAIAWTRIAINRGFLNHPFLSRHDPFLASVRSDGRFVALMDELRPRWEALVEWEATLA